MDAKEAAQRYKIGKFILETRRVVMGKMWEDVDGADGDGSGLGTALGQHNGEKKGADGEEEVVFDSEDEDECEDLFAGVWDPEVAKRRRDRRVSTRRRVEEV